MTLLQLVTALRRRLDDLADVQDALWQTDDDDYDWSNQELTDYLNEAHEEYTRRVPLVDRTTAQDNDSLPLTAITLVGGTAAYALSPKILTIRWMLRAVGTDINLLTALTRREFLNLTIDGTAEVGEYYYLDGDMNSVTILATPTAADAITMEVTRLPLVTWDWDTDQAVEPEIRKQDHRHLVHYAEYLALIERSDDTVNINKAEAALGRFTRAVGPPTNAFIDSVRRDIHGSNTYLTTYGY